MSSFYNSEPPTSGKVVLKTSLGDFDIELWPKEAPKATRNFVQLCLEGYYDGTIFHRVIENFIAQGGDPMGTGSGGESIYEEAFKDEFHSRLRFTHRGLVGCANANRPHSNNSQFFFTLDKCEQLTRKNTIFGTITGESLFNLASLSELETDADDRPVVPPVVRSADVIWNPFDDIVPRTTPEERLAAAAAQRLAEDESRKKERAQRKAQKGLLSFAEEDGAADADESVPEATTSPPVPSTMRSAHDVIDDGRLVRERTQAAEALATEEAEVDEERRQKQAAVRQALTRPGGLPEPSVRLDERAQDFAARMHAAAQAKRKAMDPSPGPQLGGDAKRQAIGPVANSGQDESGDSSDEKEDKTSLLEKRKQEQLAQLSSKQASVKPSQQAQVQDTSLMSESQKRLAALKQQSRMTARSQQDMKADLAAFQARLQASKLARAAAAEDGATTSTDAATKAAQEQEAYAGRVRNDIDHDQLKPAAWRADNYLDGDSDDDLDVIMRGGPLIFPKMPARNDDMARREHVDDYAVEDPMAQGVASNEARPQGHWRDGPGHGPEQQGPGPDRAPTSGKPRSDDRHKYHRSDRPQDQERQKHRPGRSRDESRGHSHRRRDAEGWRR